MNTSRHAPILAALAAALLLGIPWLAQIPLSAMMRFNPDLAVLLVVGAVAALARGTRIMLGRTDRLRADAPAGS